jgi:hypothetical protein
MFRNLFTLLGVVAVFGVFFFFIRPDWVKQISSSPTSQGPAVLTKVNANLSAERMMMKDLPKDGGGLLHFEKPEYAPLAVEDVGDDLPSRNTPFLMVINKSNNSMRYCKLSPNVRKAALRVDYSGVKLKEVSNTPGGPYQVIIWVPNAFDLQVELELLTAAPSRS